uniref:BAR domain-containing protein n=1 Tax=Oryzias melastigma TaxID=30732 RepID=A0A3B3CBF8_ORYME
MDLTRLAVDAGQFINRAVQYTEENLGQAEKTALDPGLEELLALADATKVWTDQIISQAEVLLQPNPGARLEDRLYEHLEWSAPPRLRAHELLGEEMIRAGLEVGSTTPYGTALMRCGETQKQLGETERKFVQSTNIHFLTPLRSFTEGEYRAIQVKEERKMLVNKRLDLDIAKSRVMKAHQADREARAEMELRICQSLFDRQAEITQRLLEGLSSTHINHMCSLTDFVDAQASYFAECNQHAQELQKHLASIPAVFCSNNWRSALSSTVSGAPRNSCVDAQTVGLDDVTLISAVVHQLPDFDQDSWALNSPTKTETDPSLTGLDPTNNNVSGLDSSSDRLPAAASAGATSAPNACPVREEETISEANGDPRTTTVAGEQ